MATIFKRIAGIITRIEDGFLTGLLTVMIFLSFIQIVLRLFFDAGISWADPMLRNMVLWVGFLGAAVASKDDDHITIDLISRFLPPRARAAGRVLTDLFTAVVCAFMTYASFNFVRGEAQMGAVLFGKFPIWLAQLVLPVAFGIIALRSFRYCGINLVRSIKGIEEKNEEGQP